MRARSDGIGHPKKAAMLVALSKTGNVSAAARAADISRSTHYEWMETDPAYREAAAEAFEVAIEVLEAAARQRALHGSDTLMIFLLKSLRPERYRERYEVRHDTTRQLADRIRADVAKVLADQDLCRRLEDEFLGMDDPGPGSHAIPKE